MAFWIMFAVSASGVVGRYLYAQIPRKVSTAELSMKELQDLQEGLAQQLAAQHLLPEADLPALLHLPDAGFVKRLPTVVALVNACISSLPTFYYPKLQIVRAILVKVVGSPSPHYSMAISQRTGGGALDPRHSSGFRSAARASAN